MLKDKTATRDHISGKSYSPVLYSLDVAENSRPCCKFSSFYWPFVVKHRPNARSSTHHQNKVETDAYNNHFVRAHLK